MKRICEIFLNFTFGQDNSRKSIFQAKLKQTRIALNFPRLEIEKQFCVTLQ